MAQVLRGLFLVSCVAAVAAYAWAAAEHGLARGLVWMLVPGLPWLLAVPITGGGYLWARRGEPDDAVTEFARFATTLLGLGLALWIVFWAWVLNSDFPVPPPD